MATRALYSVILICLVVCGQIAAAQQVTYIKAGKLLDVADGRMLTDRTIVVRGDRIARTGSASSIDIPADANVVDLSDATVLPGLIDVHVHLTGDPDAHGYKSLAASVPRNALFGAANARRVLTAGFTTVRNVGAGGYADIALRDAINHGDVPGPRLAGVGGVGDLDHFLQLLLANAAAAAETAISQDALAGEVQGLGGSGGLG